MPAAPSDADVRRAKIRKITDAAAQKIKAVAKKESKAFEKQQHLLKETAVDLLIGLRCLCLRAGKKAVDLLRKEYGHKQKATPTAVQEKLAKACRCHLSLAPGHHKDKCNFHPVNMRSILRRNIENRAAIEQQLRTRTTLSPEQRETALGHLIGPPVVVVGGSSSSGFRASGKDLNLGWG